jgi:membrane glycosyltransferase
MNATVRHWTTPQTALADRYPMPRTRRLLFAALVTGVTAVGVSLMVRVLSGNGLQMLELVVLALFAITFLWIAQAFCSALIGATLYALRLDPLTLRPYQRVEPGLPVLRSRTAVVMPVHNEDVDRVVAGLEATCLDVQEAGLGASFDFFLLSDSTDDTIAARERRAMSRLRERLDGCLSQLFYRRRHDNQGRKAGNIAEFCERWGEYDHFVILDADSVMSARSLARLAAAMERNPRAGIIQTVPVPVRQRSVFGRGVQFAASLYSPLLATGQSFWQMDASNYWGHNAIIRLAPFREHCQLPVLPGAPPLGGEILSHDFVEAALMRRAGWHVLLMPDLGGSFEEVPGNILDFAKRDRRWSEGNLQHVRLLPMRGLHPISRLHFLLGAFAYGCSFLWLLMLLTSSADAIHRALGQPQYFSAGPALFPDWPISRAADMWSLLGIVVAMLFLPKVLGVILCLADPARRRAFGGGVRVVVSALLEMVLSVLIAPVLMCFHARFVAVILLGRRARWDAQDRDGRQLRWSEAWRSTALLSLAGVLWGLLVYFTTPIFFWALLPVLVGLVLSCALVAGTSHLGLGDALARWGIFRTPAESRPDRVLQQLEALSGHGAERRVRVPAQRAHVGIVNGDAGSMSGVL